MPKTGSLYYKQIQTTFPCNVCGKIFSSLNRCENHEIKCRARHYCNTEMTDHNDIPTNKELFAMIKILHKENKELKRQLVFAKRGETIQKQQEILSWLNENINPSITFDIFIKRLESNMQNIEEIFTHGYKDATSKLLYDKYSDLFNGDFKNLMPIYSFTQKDNMIYIYNGEKWELLQNDIWDKTCVAIKQMQLISFEAWKEENISNIYDEKQQSNWLDKMQRLHCLPPYTCNNLNPRIKKKFYNMIKCNFSELIAGVQECISL